MATETSAVVPIAEPITGREPAGDPGAPRSALAQFYRAFNSRDLALMEANWDSSPEVAMDNPLGGILRGWPEIRKVYERIFSAPRRVEVEFHDYTLHATGDVFYVVGRERGRIVADATRPEMRLAIRTTRIYRRVGERWRQVHHHGSMDDPTMLEAYQRAVRRDAAK
jgi:ketosteroid isomerase-like protein